MSLDEPGSILSPILTIAAPTAEHHDRLDAYAILAARLRDPSLFDSSPPPALAPLQPDLLHALRRDIRLAHVDPLSSFHHSAHLKQHIADSSSLCHHALSALATLFRCPALHLVLPEHALSLLFKDVLDIALADRLPVFNPAKTYSLALWILGSHRLPTTAIAACKDDISRALRCALNGPHDVVFDGLTALSHTMEYHPSEFLDPLSPLLPHVLRNLLSDSSKLCLRASIVLGKFANALIHQTDLSMTNWQTISNHITSFLDGDDSINTTFLPIVRAAFSAEPHTGHTPTSILATLASLIVLYGPTLYTNSTALRLILQALAIALTHKRSIVRALHPHVWNCFVWTFAQLLSGENVDSALTTSAFHVIKQEVSGGVGVALVGTLLSDRMPLEKRSDRVYKALSVIKAMARTDCDHTCREGFLFLQALTNDARGHQLVQDMYELPASILVNGAIIGAEWNSLPSIIRSIPKLPVSMYRLEKMEIAQHCKTLLDIWKYFATKADRNELGSALVDTWFTILLVCEQHDGATTEVPRYAAGMIAEFLPSVALSDSEPDWGSWDVHDQLYSLTFIEQLWSPMRNAFAASSLVEAAAIVLASILKYAFHVLDRDVRTVWGRLCASLMTTAPPSFLKDTREPMTSQLVIHNQRELWGVVATSLSSSELDLVWKELVRFLAIPICNWVLSAPELEAWKALLWSAITRSEDRTTVIKHFILQHLQGKEVESWESIVAVLGFFLGCTQRGDSPVGELLYTINVCLTVSYDRAYRSPNALAHSLELLNVIRNTITSVGGNVLHILRALSSSLCLWIEDNNEVMSDDEFNSVVVSLYCRTLETLRVLPLSVESLRETENFLASAFSRIPPPGTAPFAFENYWRATYHGRAEFYDNLPEKIRSSISCFVAAYGGDLADGLLSTESQSISIGGDSQAFFFSNHRYDRSGEGSLQFNQLSTSMDAEAHGQVASMEISHQQSPVGQNDATFSGGDMLQPTALRRLQEYSSQMETFSTDFLERSMNSSRIILPPILTSRDEMCSPRSPEEDGTIDPYVPGQKRKHVADHSAPRKRSETVRDTLYFMRDVASEPASRDVTPVDPPRMHSVPLKKRSVFDGVVMPTLREALRRKAKADGTKNITNVERRLVSTPGRGARGKCRAMPSSLPTPVESDEDDLDWENVRVHATSSEADVDKSLYAISSPRPPTSVHADDGSRLSRESRSQKAVSDGPSVPVRPSLQRAKTTSARLEALQHVYSSVAHGSSQIPISELLQATKLVHQIGAALTERMGKNAGDPG